MKESRLSTAQMEVVKRLQEGWVLKADDDGYKPIIYLEERELQNDSGWYRVIHRIWVSRLTFSVLVRKGIISNVDGGWKLSTGR